MTRKDPAPKADDRYGRQVRVHGFGAAAQDRIRAARVTIVGIGALGSRVAEDLARAGVGHLRLIDRDWVELSNLHRQHLFDETDAAAEEPKCLAAARRIAAINSDVEVEPWLRDLGPLDAGELLGGADLLIDGTDNFQTRYLVNDFAVREGKPWIYGACVSSQAMVSAFLPGRACLRCVFPKAPPTTATQTCETAGILPPAAAFVAAWQTSLALRILGLPGARPAAELTTADVLAGDIRTMQLPSQPDPRCAACSTRRYPALDAAAATRSKKLCGRDAVQLSAPSSDFPPLEELAARLADIDHELTRYMLRLRVPEGRITLFRNGRAIVQGTQDEGRARAIFDRYVGS